MLSRSQRKNILLTLVFGLMVIVGAAYFVLTYSPSSVDKLFGFLGQVPVVKYLPAVQDRQAAEFIIIDDQSESFDLKINNPKRAQELASQLELPAGKTQVRLVLVDEELNHKFVIQDELGDEWTYLSIGIPKNPTSPQPHQLEVHLKISPRDVEGLEWSNEILREQVEIELYSDLIRASESDELNLNPMEDVQQRMERFERRVSQLHKYLNILNESSLFAISW